MESKERNKLLPAVIVLAILAVAGCGFGVWGVINGAMQGKEVDELKAEISSKNEELADLKGITVEEVVNENNEEIVAHEKKSANIPLIKGKEILPATGGFEAESWSVVGDGAMSGISLHLRQSLKNGEENKINIQYNPVEMNRIYGLNLTGGEKIQTLEVGNIDVNKVVDVKIGLFGQAVSDRETLLYLMEDGTIEYNNIKEGLQNGKFDSEGALPGVEDVVRLYVVDLNGRTIYAQRADGDYYDLNDYLPE